MVWKYGDKPGGFCQKSRECRSGEEQGHKSPTPGDGPDEYRRAVKSILIYLENIIIIIIIIKEKIKVT